LDTNDYSGSLLVTNWRVERKLGASWRKSRVRSTLSRLSSRDYRITHRTSRHSNHKVDCGPCLTAMVHRYAHISLEESAKLWNRCRGNRHKEREPAQTKEKD